VAVHPAGDVDRVPEDVVDEFVAADDARDGAAAADADPPAELQLVLGGVVPEVLAAGQGHVSDGGGVRLVVVGQACGGHVDVADGLDLLHAEGDAQVVEQAHDVAQVLVRRLLRQPHVGPARRQPRDLEEHDAARLVRLGVPVLLLLLLLLLLSSSSSSLLLVV
jgi:hypothetical protein